MTSNSATKKAIRERMAATGEPYMQARRNIEIGQIGSTTEPGAWIIHQRVLSPSDSEPYPWVLHEDGSTHGFIDHGHLIGVVQDPDDRLGMRHLPRPLTDEAVRSMVGCYPVTIDRFTRQWATWTQPISHVEQAAPNQERTALYGGLIEDSRNAFDQERAQRRADADRRWVADVSEHPATVSDVFFEDGEVLDVEPGGATREGLIVGFVTDDDARVLTSWADVEQDLAAGRDLARLSGLRVSVQPNDMASPRLLYSPVSEVVLDSE